MLMGHWISGVGRRVATSIQRTRYETYDTETLRRGWNDSCREREQRGVGRLSRRGDCPADGRRWPESVGSSGGPRQRHRSSPARWLARLAGAAPWEPEQHLAVHAQPLGGRLDCTGRPEPSYLRHLSRTRGRNPPTPGCRQLANPQRSSAPRDAGRHNPLFLASASAERIWASAVIDLQPCGRGI